MGTILVTGASRGIGSGIAQALAKAGHRIAIHYNGNREAALSTAANCTELFAESGAAGENTASIFQADISKAPDRERLINEVYERFGSIDGLVNNAGIAPRKRDDIVVAEEEIFDEVMRVNLYGPYFLTQLVARRWLESPGGTQTGSGAEITVKRRIVFVTSVSAGMVSVARGEYCVSKAGLSMAAQLYAARLAGDGIPVLEVRPGIVATDMTSGVKGKYDALIEEGLVPQRRWGYPSDTGSVVASIMDGNLDFSTGSVIYTDGGLHISRL